LVWIEAVEVYLIGGAASREIVMTRIDAVLMKQQISPSFEADVSKLGLSPFHGCGFEEAIPLPRIYRQQGWLRHQENVAKPSISVASKMRNENGLMNHFLINPFSFLNIGVMSEVRWCPRSRGHLPALTLLHYRSERRSTGTRGSSPYNLPVRQPSA
jgi:hypothetical protein